MPDQFNVGDIVSLHNSNNCSIAPGGDMFAILRGFEDAVYEVVQKTNFGSKEHGYKLKHRPDLSTKTYTDIEETIIRQSCNAVNYTFDPACMSNVDKDNRFDIYTELRKRLTKEL